MIHRSPHRNEKLESDIVIMGLEEEQDWRLL
jgi:hypothetical protein